MTTAGTLPQRAFHARKGISVCGRDPRASLCSNYANIAGGALALFYVGLALFLTGSGLNVTCIDMMLTQRLTPEDPRRVGAFLWNFAGMNVGFFVGFSAAGYFQATESYASLFIFATLGNCGAIVLASFNWKTLTHRNTPLLHATRKQFRLRQLAALATLIGLP